MLLTGFQVFLQMCFLTCNFSYVIRHIASTFTILRLLTIIIFPQQKHRPTNVLVNHTFSRLLIYPMDYVISFIVRIGLTLVKFLLYLQNE